MSDNQSRPEPPRGGVIQDIGLRVRLVARLLADPRVSLWLKVLPVGSLLYLFFPDLLIGPIDDALLLWLASTLFVELAPPEIVAEHMRSLQGLPPTPGEGPVVDAEFRDPVASEEDQK